MNSMFFFSGAVPLFFRMMIFPIYKNPTKVPAKICSFRKKKAAMFQTETTSKMESPSAPLHVVPLGVPH